MLTCECGREFSNKNGLSRHKPFCKGLRRCQNSSCNKILTSPDQEKYCSSRCATVVTGPGRKHSIETRNRISKSLGGKGVSKKSTYCLFCNSPLPHGRKYCNVECKTLKERKDKTEKWLHNPELFIKPAACMKHWLIEQHGEKCHICGWNTVNKHTGKIPLEMHHKDGNWKNNYPDNITLICPNCHSLTETYRIGNRGNGRKWAREYYRGKTR